MSLRILGPLGLGVSALALLGYVAVASGTAPADLARDLPPAVPSTAPVVAPVMAQPALAPAAAPARRQGPAVAPGWLAGTAAEAGLPVPALRAYATAQLRLSAEEAGCHLGWTTLAGIGWIESQHGTYEGRTLGEDGVPSSPVTGPTLDGAGDLAAVPGDGNGVWARAAGPMQFLPSTWATWASDGDGDGVEDVQDLDDAAYAAGRYLCASGDLATGAGWSRAVLSYNHSQAYVDTVRAAAQAYADRTT